jgi:phage-related tail fiber protein
MSDYNTGNSVPSVDPRDLDDNATVLDLLMNSTASSVSDRTGVDRKTWYQIEIDASALVSPNVSALAGLTGSNNLGLYFTGSGAMATYAFTPFMRALEGSIDGPAVRTGIGAISASDNITGSAAKLTTARSIAATGDGAWSVSFDGSASATAALTLAATGVTAGTYGSVTVNTKGLVTAATVATPIANGGTGQTTQSAALTALLSTSAVPLANGGTGATTATAAGANLGTSVVGTNTDQLAKSSMIQAEIANKRTWTSYTPTVTAASGTFTTVSATGRHMVAFGICHYEVVITVTTKGTGANPTFTLPFAALTGTSVGMPCAFAREGAVNGNMGIAVIATGLASSTVFSYAGPTGDLASGNGAVISIKGSYPIA